MKRRTFFGWLSKTLSQNSATGMLKKSFNFAQTHGNCTVKVSGGKSFKRNDFHIYVQIFEHFHLCEDLCGRVAGPPETMCPCTNFLGPLVPKLIVPGDTMSLHWYIPVILHYAVHIGWCKMAGMYQCKDILFPDESFGGLGSQKKFAPGTHRSGHPVTSPFVYPTVYDFTPDIS